MTTSGWALRRIADPAIEPITLEEAKLQCQIDADLTEQDSVILGYIKAAREKAEAYCKRSFIEQTWKLTARSWPVDMQDGMPNDAIILSHGPVLGIVEISYLDGDGTRTYLAADEYLIDEGDEPPRLYPPYNECWPGGRCTPGAIEIVYRTGYPSAGSPVDAANVPQLAKQAIGMLVGHWYNNAREDSIIGTIIADAPHGFYSTLDPLRIYP